MDFSTETERTLQVLDYAVLVVSGTDGVQSHTETLWRLLRRYRKLKCVRRTECQKGGGQYGESWRKKQWNLMQDWVNLVTRYCGI